MSSVIHSNLWIRMTSWAQSRRALVLAFVWGLAEATFFFIVPDVCFMFTALFLPGRGFLHGLTAILGTLTGGIIMYSLAAVYPGKMIQFLNQVPAISADLIQQVRESLQMDGFASLLSAPLQGIPYKIYAVESAVLNMDIGGLLLWTLPSRLERVVVLTLIMAAVGMIFRRHIMEHTRFWLGLYASGWILFYVFYFSNRGF